MFIDVSSSLDKIEGFRNESFEPEEIELYLNKSQYRLLDDLINKNFQQGTLRYEWLRAFQLTTQSSVNFISDNQTADVVFPSNLYYLIAGRANVVLSTGKYSSGGTSEKLLDDIDDPLNVPNPVNVSNQLNIEETGTVSDKEQNIFYGTNYRNPRAELIKNGLRLYRGKKFIISNVNFDYVRAPVNIDVSSTDNTEWPVSANEKIVDYTVEYMKLTVGDESYSGNVQDFNLRTQNV